MEETPYEQLTTTDQHSPTFTLPRSNGSRASIVVESDSHYLLAVDVPTLPLLQTEILRTENELVIEGSLLGSVNKQTFLHMYAANNGINTIYKDGILWLLLPKNQISNQEPKFNLIVA